MSAFLMGEWRYHAMLNYRVDASSFVEHLPRGTELDSWNRATYVSIVGFLFRHTRVLGVPMPLHRNFEEVNLRFYVRRDVDGERRRAVTFIREIVPRRAIAAMARLAYNEPYIALPMRHTIECDAGEHARPVRVEYAWRHGRDWSRLVAEPAGPLSEIASGSEAEFITEHYWGYTRPRDGGTVEYRVTHPRWRVWRVGHAAIRGNLHALYGARLGAAVSRAPDSAFVADGSAVAVGSPARLRISKR